VARIYNNTRLMCNQDVMPGIVASNGQFIVDDGMQAIFEGISWVAKLIRSGDVYLVETDNPDTPPPATGLSLAAAAKIADMEFRVPKAKLRRLLVTGVIPGYSNGNYDIGEEALRKSLTDMSTAVPEPEPEPDPEPEPVVEPAPDPEPEPEETYGLQPAETED